ncbi:MAG: hypothetical protein LLG00_04370 [Planctomycetaceae bacterium]|nr:hypothetical protein [Planctomycetaceae bacterium]
MAHFRTMSRTPDLAVTGVLLTLEACLLLSYHFCWFGLSDRKGWAAMIAMTAIGLPVLLALLWLVASLVLRRRFQYSIGSMLLFVMAVAVACSVLASELRRERIQWDLAWAIKKAGGGVAAERTLLGRLLRDDSFVEIEGVFLEATRHTDDAMIYLERLGQLDRLYLGKSDVSDAGLVHLRGLKRLRLLWLNDTGITNAGLRNVGELHQLKFLRLDGTKCTDAGLLHIRGLTQLVVLSLDNTEVGDRGLTHLEGMKQLDTLHLNNTQVTDAGLAHVYGLKSLTEVTAHGTKITKQGADGLQQVRPSCEIFH